jgi:hypothetical protein
MWVIRSLNGPLAGKKFELKDGSTRLGRMNTCDIVIPHQGISKEHTEVVIEGNTVMIRDLNSSNGVFVNGVRVQAKALKAGDKIGLYDLLFDVAEVRIQKKTSPPKVNVIPFPGHGIPHAGQGPTAGMSSAAPTWDQGAAHTGAASRNYHQAPPGNFSETVRQYIENVVLPGVYSLGTSTEFRWVIGGFVTAFIVLVTTLSVIPMIQITKTSVERESQKRALTIASSLADRYLRALQDGNVAQFSVESASREEGVDDAYIISSEDGRVLAPAQNAGSSPDKPFLHSARKSDRKSVQQLDSTTIGAAAPIVVYNPDTGKQTPQAHAIIIYNLGALAIDDGRILSLVIQVFLIAAALGLLLFYFLVRFIEYPVRDLTTQIDQALLQGRDFVKTTYLFPEFQKLVDNVNAALSRAMNPTGAPQMTQLDRSNEISNLFLIMGVPALAISRDGLIMSISGPLEDLTGIRAAYYLNNPVTSISEQSLARSIEDLLIRSRQVPHEVHTNDLDVFGKIFELKIQSIMGAEGPDAYIVSMKEKVT